MSKTMKFRNSGKLDLAGKNMEYVLAGALLLIIIGAVVLSVGGLKCGSGGGPEAKMGPPRVKCTECDEEWEVEKKEARLYDRDMEMERDMGGVPMGTDCPKCGEKECVFLMRQCPNPDCKKYFLSGRVTDYDAFIEGGKKEICPHCKTDLHEYYKELRRKRR